MWCNEEHNVSVWAPFECISLSGKITLCLSAIMSTVDLWPTDIIRSYVKYTTLLCDGWMFAVYLLSTAHMSLSVEYSLCVRFVEL